MEKKISFFNNVKAKNNKVLTYENIFNDIKNGKYKSEIEQIRELYFMEEEDVANDLKSNLPAFTPTGIFYKQHNKEDLKNYNNVIVIDIDYLDMNNVQAIKEQISNDLFAWVVFISPRGHGLKITSVRKNP